MNKPKIKKQEITKETAVSELRQLFKIDGSTQSKENNGVFWIHKSEFVREEVIKALMDYFKTRTFVPGYCCAVEPMTIIWTVFKVEERKEDKK